MKYQRRLRVIVCVAAPLALLAALSGCATSRPRLEGAWECVAPRPAPGAAPAVKVLTGGHFAFGTQSSDGGTVFAGGGTWSHDGQTYTEHVSYHWCPVLVGETIVFDCELKDGLWYHRSRPSAEGEPIFIDEVWRRLETPGRAR